MRPNGDPRQRYLGIDEHDRWDGGEALSEELGPAYDELGSPRGDIFEGPAFGPEVLESMGAPTRARYARRLPATEEAPLTFEAGRIEAARAPTHLGPEPAWQPGGAPGLGVGPYANVGPVGYRRSDERIREDVCELLAWDSWVDASRIEVECKEQVVRLSGPVPHRWMKRRAELLLDGVRGIRDVHNGLWVEIGDDIDPERTDQ